MVITDFAFVNNTG